MTKDTQTDETLEQVGERLAEELEDSGRLTTGDKKAINTYLDAVCEIIAYKNLGEAEIEIAELFEDIFSGITGFTV